MRVLPERLLDDPLDEPEEELFDELFEDPELFDVFDDRAGVDRLDDPDDLLPVYPFDERLLEAGFDTVRRDVLTRFLYWLLLLALGRDFTFLR